MSRLRTSTLHHLSAFQRVIMKWEHLHQNHGSGSSFQQNEVASHSEDWDNMQHLVFRFRLIKANAIL